MALSRSLLHIEPDGRIQRGFSQALTDRGWEVATLDEPLSAGESLMQHGQRICVVSLDGPEGTELLRRLKRHDGCLLLLGSTTSRSVSFVLEALRRGAETCVLKPYRCFDEVAAALDLAYDKLRRAWQLLRRIGQERIRGSESFAAARKWPRQEADYLECSGLARLPDGEDLPIVVCDRSRGGLGFECRRLGSCRIDTPLEIHVGGTTRQAVVRNLRALDVGYFVGAEYLDAVPAIEEPPQLVAAESLPQVARRATGQRR